MPSLTAIKNQTDNWIANNALKDLATWQAPYIVSKGRYFQGLATHSTPVQHSQSSNGDKKPDKNKSKPTDQAEDWDDFMTTGFIKNNTPAAVTLDVYDGPQGKGYVLNVFFDYEDGGIATWRKSVGVGPESRNTNWISN